MIYRAVKSRMGSKSSNWRRSALLWRDSYQEALTIYSSGNLSFDGPFQDFRLSLEASAHLTTPLNDAHERLLASPRLLCVGTTFLSCENAKVAGGHVCRIQEDHLDTAEKESRWALL